MRRAACSVGLVLIGIFLGGRLLSVSLRQPVEAGQAKSPAPSKHSPTLDDLVSGRLSIIDLTWTLDAENPYWPAENYEPFRLQTIATLEKNGVLSKAFYTPEHLGTHLDAPNHFEPNQPSVDQLKPDDLFAPGVVIDLSMKCELDADCRLTVADIAAWEETYGRIPNRAVVFLHTGWGRHWRNYPRYKNQDATGKMHFPGFSQEAAEFLVTERQVRGIGIDTLSIDYGLSTDFIVHHVINRAGRYGLENVAHLDQLPAKDFFVFVAPVKIRTGSGGPTRILAMFPPSVKAD